MDKPTAERIIAAGEADAVAWGKAFIANPDLPRRLREDAPLNAAKPETFYAPTAEGYTDYPALA
jgi:2,4-dienoyl-CoA reductase-like NADH-dependent reductase (Old Yellow Enzyme family)